MIIRKAKEEDVKRMNYLKRKTFEKINSKDYPKKVIKEYCKKQTPSKIKRQLKTADVFLLVDEKDKILGMIDLYDTNIIGGLYVKFDYVGKGIGKKLLKYLEKYAKKKGLKKLILFPTKTAQKFYEKMGYKYTKKLENWEIAGHKYKVPKMEKKL